MASSGFVPGAPVAAERVRRTKITASIRQSFATARDQLNASSSTPTDVTGALTDTGAVRDCGLDVDPSADDEGYSESEEEDMDVDDTIVDLDDDMLGDGEGLGTDYIVSHPEIPTDQLRRDDPPIISEDHAGMGPSSPAPTDLGPSSPTPDVPPPPTVPPPDADPVPPPAVPWMPGGPFTNELLKSYETHIARAIYELTVVDPPAPVIPAGPRPLSPVCYYSQVYKLYSYTHMYVIPLRY